MNEMYKRSSSDVICDGRSLSDSDLVAGGAVYRGSVLRPTPEQLAKLHGEFEQRDRSMATRALVLGDLIRGGAYHRDGVLVITPEQLECLSSSQEGSPIDGKEPQLPTQSVDTVHPSDLLSAHQNELQLDTNVHTILQPYLAMIASNTPREQKALFGDKKRVVNWDVSRRISELPEVIVRSKTTYSWSSNAYQVSNHNIILGVDKDSIKSSEKGYFNSHTAQMNLDFSNGTLNKLRFTRADHNTALMVALREVGILAPLPESIANDVYNIVVDMGASKKLQINSKYTYTYDNLEDRFVATTSTSEHYPSTLSTCVYENILQSILNFAPTTSY